jgi:hypothetical protein
METFQLNILGTALSGDISAPRLLNVHTITTLYALTPKIPFEYVVKKYQLISQGGRSL